MPARKFGGWTPSGAAVECGDKQPNAMQQCEARGGHCSSIRLCGTEARKCLKLQRACEVSRDYLGYWNRVTQICRLPSPSHNGVSQGEGFGPLLLDGTFSTHWTALIISTVSLEAQACPGSAGGRIQGVGYVQNVL